jgi:Penicillinase repressor.
MKYMHIQVVIDILKERKCMKLDEVRAELSKYEGRVRSANSVYRLLNRLVRKGILVKKERGIYCYQD